jgi:hypothetical protein
MVEGGKLGLAFVVVSFQHVYVVRVLVLLVVTIACRAELLSNTTAKHKIKRGKSKHRIVWWYWVNA